MPRIPGGPGGLQLLLLASAPEVTSTVTSVEAKAFLEGKDVSPSATAAASATATAPGTAQGRVNHHIFE